MGYTFYIEVGVPGFQLKPREKSVVGESNGKRGITPPVLTSFSVLL